MSRRVLVVAIGNDARGDDGIGAVAARRLEALSPPGVEVLEVHQLQVEHVLDIAQRDAVVFVDAAVHLDRPFAIDPLRPRNEAVPFSHALSPPALLDAFRTVEGREPPPAWVFAIRGESFELGAEVGDETLAALDAGWTDLLALLERLVRPAAGSRLPNPASC